MIGYALRMVGFILNPYTVGSFMTGWFSYFWVMPALYKIAG